MVIISQLMNDLQVFNNEEFGTIRTIEIDSEPWFVAKDITERLGYINSSDAIGKHVDEEDKGVAKCDTLGGIQNVTVINESGLYSLVLSSQVPNAKKFRRWITSEVIPSIRKTGGYHLPQTMAEALRLYADEVERSEKLALENKQLTEDNRRMSPKEEIYDITINSEELLDLSEVAKIINCGLGRNKLFEFLRREGMLRGNNEPYQEFVDRGYCQVKESPFERNGSTRIGTKTYFTQKGVEYIIKRLRKAGVTW